MCSIFRSQGNHDLLLHLYDAHHDLARSRFWSHTPWIPLVSLLCGRSKRFHLGAVHLPFDQRLCGLPAVRRWHKTICLAVARLFDWNVHPYRRHLDPDVQEQSGLRTHKHSGDVRGPVSHQWNLLAGLRRHADHPRREHTPGQMATRRYCLRRRHLRRGPSDPVRLQRQHLQQRPALPGRSLLRHHM